MSVNALGAFFSHIDLILKMHWKCYFTADIHISVCVPTVCIMSPVMIVGNSMPVNFNDSRARRALRYYTKRSTVVLITNSFWCVSSFVFCFCTFNERRVRTVNKFQFNRATARVTTIRQKQPHRTFKNYLPFNLNRVNKINVPKSYSTAACTF